ncbi:MAG TPA: photosynthetic complex assembly protein PuhC [Paracoccaceae bacterium]|nr:photosynthetic complex assembly protein PuhC [Paracoccaceae bacterium]HMO70420.1 photosynthetic complex assembly protein PuhC [Paracoccaceae bacterium]
MTTRLTATQAPDREREMIPRVLVRAMFALALASLAIVTYARLTDRPTVGQPAAAEAVTERVIALVGGGAQAVRVLDADGALLADLAHGGFITVIQNGLMTVRRRHGIDPALPVRLVEYANGRTTIEDPLTGWSVELYAFGADNLAAFRRILSD